MINYYLYQDQNIGIYEHRIDFIRNEYNNDNVEYPDITRIIIRKGLARRWILLLSIGVALMLLAFLMTLTIYKNSSPTDFFTNLLLFWKGSRGSGFIAMIFLLVFGLYCLIISLKKKVMLIIESRGESLEFVIDGIYKDKKLDGLIAFLQTRVKELIIDEKLTNS